jgi:hypothetical protein
VRLAEIDGRSAIGADGPISACVNSASSFGWRIGRRAVVKPEADGERDGGDSAGDEK